MPRNMILGLLVKSPSSIKYICDLLKKLAAKKFYCSVFRAKNLLAKRLPNKSSYCHQCLAVYLTSPFVINFKSYTIQNSFL